MKRHEGRIFANAAEDSPKYETLAYQRSAGTRVLQYFHEQTAMEFFQHTIAPVASGATLGICVGACVGGPGGAIIGGGIGIAGGSAYSVYANYHAYKEWLALHKETAVFNEFESLHRDHPALREFIDPVTHILALDPVRDPFGLIYDRSTLVALSKRRVNGMIADPIEHREFSMEQVQDAPEVLARLKAVYKVLLQQELEADMIPEVRRGLIALVGDLDQQIINYVTRETTRLTGQLRSGAVSLQQFMLQMNELTQRMNPSV